LIPLADRSIDAVTITQGRVPNTRSMTTRCSRGATNRSGGGLITARPVSDPLETEHGIATETSLGGSVTFVLRLRVKFDHPRTLF
jgi:hypothetical protein